MEYKILHKITPGQRLRVAAYARISSDKDVAETSLEEQIDYYTKLIVQNLNWDFAGIYYDDGISGTTISRRKGFMRLVDNARAGLIDVILVKSVSRFSRNLVDLLEIMQELRKLGVEIFFEQQNTSSLDVKSDQIITLYAKFAEEEAISVSENQKWRLDVDRKRGHYHLPVEHMMGYRYDENGKITIHEEEAKTIRLIYKLYLEDVGTTSIAQFLKENKYTNRRGSTSWSVSSVNYILKNEKYAGDCLLQKAYSEDPLTKKKKYNHGERDQYLIQNGHPAIVDRDTWNKVQEKFKIMGEKFNVHSYVRENMSTKRVRYEFTGWILCPYCGSNYLVKTNHYNGIATNKHLMCYSNHKTKLCKSENYPLEVFKQIVEKQLKILKSNQVAFKEVLMSETPKDGEDNISIEITSLNEQIEKLRIKYDEIKNHHDDFFKRLQEETINQINGLVKRRSYLQNEQKINGSFKQRVNTIIESLKSIPNQYDDLENIDFKSVLARAIIVDKEHIYFVVGNGDIKNPPLKPKLYFKSTIEYRIRKSIFQTEFGIIVNP